MYEPLPISKSNILSILDKAVEQKKYNDAKSLARGFLATENAKTTQHGEAPAALWT
jgi:hypothetical protein